ncbi:unnamed protein product, partial [Vitis vinifera]
MVLEWLEVGGYERDDHLFLHSQSKLRLSFECDNMIERPTNLDWYKGSTLLEVLDMINEPKRPSNKPMCFPSSGCVHDWWDWNCPNGTCPHHEPPWSYQKWICPCSCTYMFHHHEACHSISPMNDKINTPGFGTVKMNADHYNKLHVQ